ncbi:hypothetical protein H7K13_23570 [Priestia aryabhattai]|uniref:hypothetical protein n=1 Tax=Priestia aryabhattai TaxID=412384 RepID=UPI001C8EC3EB|nr:hypothetical protein [Priestia aryabhattai]MBY0077910.1 hypothetical protein [Priestia aryabhattai]
MAEKKQTKTTAASTEDVKNNDELKLSDSEKDALEVQSGKNSGQKYKLKDPETSYQEPEFTLVGDQEKELPEFPSTDLIARIQSGFIVKA